MTASQQANKEEEGLSRNPSSHIGGFGSKLPDSAKDFEPIEVTKMREDRGIGGGVGRRECEVTEMKSLGGFRRRPQWLDS